MRWIAALALALWLAACAPSPVPADPALWQVTGPDGETGWLFGTIHAQERPAQWETPAISAALGDADTVMVELAGDGPSVAETFARLARTPGMPPLSRRIAPAQADDLSAIYLKTGLSDADFSDTETWAAALTLAQAASPQSDGKYGVDGAILTRAKAKRIVELEGAEAQLSIFDTLPEREQRDLLAATLKSAMAGQAEGPTLAQAWRKGDMEAIAAETETGMLADPELREALFTARNRAWTGTIDAALRSGRKVFVAVGAAHMAGPEGLPSMLTAQGYTVTRVR